MLHANRTRILVLAIATLATISSLAPAAAQTSAAAAADKATLVIYRPTSLLSPASHPTVLIEGKPLLKTANGTKWSGELQPGHYNFQMEDKKSGVELDLAAGQIYYLKVSLGDQAWSGGGHMLQVTEEQAAKEIKTLNPLPEKAVVHPLFKKK